ncbi:MAG TPA: OmpA family protein [Steroidobacteraceae bacterium]|jgi:outer membrane protein OmpA-like peptidoglycan-associated protein|nr:OmpA family protein [Steroidobacteraceae bacterium]
MNMKLITGMGLGLALCACVSTPQPNAALESARAAVQTAESDPNVSKYAALDMEAARKDLAIADDAALHHNEAAIAQPAYLAAQNARLAQMHAAAKADDARVAAGQAERDQIVLATRNREVQNAKMATNEAKMQTSEALDQRDQATQTAAQATQEAARLQAEVDQLKATPTSRGLVLTLGDVLFDTGRSELNPGSSRKLDQLAQFLSEHKERRVQIDGFTDSVGTDSYNEELSRRRADAVKSALLVRGIDSSRISTQGYGKAYPVANNTDSGGRQLNRRVEVVIGGDNGTAIAPRS